jgi:hypothetical protein
MTLERRSRPRLLVALLLSWLAAVALLGSPPDAAAASSPSPATMIAHADAAAAPPAGAEPARSGPGAAVDDEDFLTRVEAMSANPAVQLGARILLAILLFIGGWIVAKLVAYGTFQLLTRTDFDNKLAARLGVNLLQRERRPAAEEEGSVERFIAKVVYYLVMLLVVVGVLDFAGLSQVAEPLAGFIDTVVQALPRIGKAALILIVAYFAARVLKMVITGALDSAGVDRRFAELADSGKPKGGPFSETAGRVVFWLLMVVGLAGAFDALEIEPIADPLRGAIDHIVAMLPRVGVAIALVAIGWFGGRIVRAIVRRVLQGLGFDTLVARLKIDRLTGATSPSDVVGITAMVFIIVQATIAALNEIGLATLSGPLTDMMAQFWNLLPSLAVSIVILVVATFVGQLLRRVAAGALRNLGLDRFMERLGFKRLSDRVDRLGEYSELVGYAVQVGVILLGVAQALENLGLDTWAAYVNAFLVYVVKNVAVATLVVAVGFAIGNYVRDLIRARDDAAADWMAEFARYAVLVFAFTMAVRQLDVAEDFVLMTFGLLFGGLCLGAALAFGLGGRELAGKILERRYDKARAEVGKPRPPGSPPPAPPRPPTVE